MRGSWEAVSHSPSLYHPHRVPQLCLCQICDINLRPEAEEYTQSKSYRAHPLLFPVKIDY